MSNATHTAYKVWDAPTRWFHWVNVLAVLGLIFVALLMMFGDELYLERAAKTALKELHVAIGYVFCLNLIGRVVWGFVGNSYARWPAVLPGRGFFNNVRRYLRSLRDGVPQQFIGHNPLARLSISLMFLAFVILALTGLVRAGTDIYYPPLGSVFAKYVAKPGVSHQELIPHDESLVDEVKYQKLKAFKKPIGAVHKYTAYFLMFLIILHVVAVVMAEKRGEGAIVSAMLSGKKLLSDKPADDA